MASQPIVVGPMSTKVVCPQCHSQINTEVKYRPTTKTHLIALVLCLCLCWPCVCIPYCVKGCRAADHRCPSCKAYIGTFDN